MIVYDFFSGTGSSTKAFEDAGHTVIKIELDEYFEADERDILQLTADYLIDKYGQPDFIWASPPCQTFSVASIRHYWTYEDGIAKPKNQKTLDGIERVRYTLQLIKDLNPTTGWLMENPRGMLRKQAVVQGLTRRTITYCQYGDFRMKPTDIWGELQGWTPKAMCKAGMDCHNSAKRGSDTGTQGIGGGGKGGSRLRSMIPYELGKEILEAITTRRPDQHL
jgi:site-specific DNA-cytosine methylase